MSFNLGLKAHISVSWLHPFKEQKLVLIGDSGMAVFDDTKSWAEKLAIYNHIVDSSGVLPHTEKSEVKYLDVKQSEPLRNECQHFVNVVSGEIAPLTNGREGLKVLNVLTAASLSQSKNSPIRLEKR